MKIALYYPWIYVRSGVERMIMELAQRSRHEWVIYTSHYYPEQTFPGFKDLNIVELSKVSVSRGYTSVVNAAGVILRQKIDLSSFDALVVSSEGLGDLITFRNHGIPVICYCHTPLKIIHDRFIRHRYLVENPKMKLPFLFFAGVFQMVDHLAWRYYTHVFCNSREVRRRILDGHLASADKIEVLSPGLDVSKMTPSWECQEYFLVLGRIKWWKNVELAIKAFLEFKKRYPEYDHYGLLVTGQVEPGSEEYFQMLNKLTGDVEDIVFKRDPTEEELLQAYRCTYALLYPSLNEDWGMTPLEAMAFGKPVIAVNQGGPTESIIDGETGFLVAPDPGAFADAMAKLAADPGMVRKMGEAGVDHVRQYDWNGFVQRFDDYMETLHS